MTTTILLVDDSRTIRLLVRAYLVGQGYDFVEVENGATALRAVRRRQPDLVICDVFMPGVDGWDFVRALRSDPRSEVQRTPVILVSSKQDKEVARKSLETGADMFLTKPVADERLTSAVDELLARAAARKREVDDGAEPIPRSHRG